MKKIETGIPDLVILEPRVFADDRGYFFESYNDQKLKELGLNYNFVQDNESRSKYGVIRGLHFQTGEMCQAKLIRVLKGKVLDVAVDLRKGSPTYKQWYSIVLSGENKKQFMVPRGFAHGFSVLEDDTVFCYKCDNYYSQEHDGGVLCSDPALGIDWMLPESDYELSEKDANLPLLADTNLDFQYKQT